MTVQIDFQQIRLNNNLSAVVEKYLGSAKNGKWRCPFHNDKTPSFSVKDGRYKCFGTCGASGDVVDFVAAMEKLNLKDAALKLGGYLLDLGLSPAEVRAKQAEIKAENARREAQRKVEEQAKREDAFKRVGAMTGLVERYHGQVEAARVYWHSQGLTNGTIERYRLGYCPKCPTYQHSASYVIPYYHAGNLISIRHRLANPNGCGKYRPEFTGLPNQLFNLDVLAPSSDEVHFGLLEPGEVLLVEGEVKSLYLSDIQGFPSVGIPGVESWREDWIKYFAGVVKVYVTLDPDAERKAAEITRTLNGNGIEARNVILTCKPDDFFWLNGGNPSDFMRILEQGRKAI
jgi:hypothetical protein